MASKFFGLRTPNAPHLLPAHGLPGEIVDLRGDVEAAFKALEAYVRPTANRTLTGTSSTLLVTDNVVFFDITAPHTAQLPPVAAMKDMGILIMRKDITASLISLALDPGDVGAHIYFQGVADTAGTRVLTGSDDTKQMGFYAHSDGTNWWVA